MLAFGGRDGCEQRIWTTTQSHAGQQPYLNSFSNPTPDLVSAAVLDVPAPTVPFAYSGSYSVTSGQPFSTVTGCTTSGTNNGSQTCMMTVNAGRSKSSLVAAWFTQQAPQAWCTMDCGGPAPVS